ncbi:MAG: ComEC/Rec2 family competence protein [Acetobacteraceae bacterium]
MQHILSAQQGRFALWLPVFMGAGVLIYFDLRVEPAPWVGAAIAVPSAAIAVIWKGWPRIALLPLAAAALGFTAAQVATLRALPLQPLPRGATEITGTVQMLEILPQGRRVTLATPRLDGDAPLLRALRVRLRATDHTPIGSGDMIRVRALVQSPSPPAYPGAWDLQRDAFFSGLGGYGFAIGTSEVLAHRPVSGFAGHIQLLRETIARQFQAALPGAPGAIAATLLTGVPTAIPESDREAFRASGLAHLLAVAGLHIGIVMGLAFAAARILMARWEYAALRIPGKQAASLAALIAGGGYMVLTGMHVPIVRSFAMASLFTLAVLTGRRIISLRGLALAAAFLILAEPEQVPGVSFQMSFSAVLALIAGYEALRPQFRALRGDGAGWRRWAVHLAALALTSLLAGTASAPFGAFHFGRVQLYFVVANMIAVPLTALWVMPAGLIALALMPFGLERLALVPMGWGIDLILWVARTTAGFPLAVMEVPHMPGWGLAVLAIGLAWLGIWRGRIRLAGVGLIAAGLVSPMVTRPPDLLVSADARLVGVRTEAGMYVEREKGASNFTRDAWRQYWAIGTPMPMPRAGSAAGGAILCSPTACVLHPRPGAAVVLALGGVAQTCGDAALLITLGGARAACPGVPMIDRFALRHDGAVAVWLGRGGVATLTDRQTRGERPWVGLDEDGATMRKPSLPLAPAGA